MLGMYYYGYVNSCSNQERDIDIMSQTPTIQDYKNSIVSHKDRITIAENNYNGVIKNLIKDHCPRKIGDVVDSNVEHLDFVMKITKIEVVFHKNNFYKIKGWLFTGTPYEWHAYLKHGTGPHPFYKEATRLEKF